MILNLKQFTELEDRFNSDPENEEGKWWESYFYKGWQYKTDSSNTYRLGECETGEFLVIDNTYDNNYLRTFASREEGLEFLYNLYVNHELKVMASLETMLAIPEIFERFCSSIGVEFSLDNSQDVIEHASKIEEMLIDFLIVNGKKILKNG